MFEVHAQGHFCFAVKHKRAICAKRDYLPSGKLAEEEGLNDIAVKEELEARLHLTIVTRKVAVSILGSFSISHKSSSLLSLMSENTFVQCFHSSQVWQTLNQEAVASY